MKRSFFAVVSIAITSILLMVMFQNCSSRSQSQLRKNSSSHSEEETSKEVVVFPRTPTFGIPPVNNDLEIPLPQSVPMNLQTDAALQAIEFSEIDHYVVADYWPQPALGQARINEFSYMDDSGNHITYQIQKYFSKDSSGQYFLEDYLVSSEDPNSFNWVDTWVLLIDGERGVLEIQDYFPTAISHQADMPLDHGNVLMRNKEFTSLAQGQIFDSQGKNQTGSFWNNYWIQFEGVKPKVTLPGGEFIDVVSQVEQQTVETIPDSGRTVHNYRFYFAKQIGLIAIQYFDKNWNTGSHRLLYLTKTCLVSDQVHRCP